MRKTAKIQLKLKKELVKQKIKLELEKRGKSI